MPVGGCRHDSALQPGPSVVDIREIELSVFRRISTIAGRSIVGRPMSCSDRTPSVLSVATRNVGCAGLPIADGYEVAESPGNTGFFAEKLCVSDGSWV